MTTAEKILIVGGVLNLAYAFLTGFFLSGIRMKEDKASKYLMFAHTGPLMQGAMLLGLVWALQLSTLSEMVEVWAAGLLVLGSILLAAKDTFNWLHGIQDEFKDKHPLGTTLGGLSVITATIGLLIIVVGVIAALL